MKYQFSLHTMPGYCYLTPVWDISFLHTMSGYCYLIPMWDNSFLHTMPGYSYLTPVWDNSFLHTMSGYCYLIQAWDISFLPTMSGNSIVQYVSIVTASTKTLTFYFRFQTTDKCYVLGYTCTA